MILANILLFIVIMALIEPKQEKKANKIYEKLNRLYYNDSKKSGKHQLDIMKSILKSNRRLNH